MTKARRNGMLWLLFCSAIFIAWGAFIEHNAPGGMVDFKAVYYGARCLLQHRDPYQASEFLSVYLAEGGKLPSDPVMYHSFLRAVPVCINLPTSLFLAAPFALLAWGPAHLLWMVIVGGSLILSAFLTWDLSSDYAPVLSVVLIGFVLANCELLFRLGNTAGIALTFCVVAVWCFFNERFVPAGILCLAIGLAVKPHDVGFVWLYFLLAGRTNRKRALQALAISIVLGVAAILWVTHVSPNWIHELHANLAATSVRGDLNDAGPMSMSIRHTGMIIDLQTLISVFRDDPRVYNPASYLICGALLLVWLLNSLRSRWSLPKEWFALAALAALTMLPTYHRQYDAKLLMLAVPACSVLWAEGRPIRWVATAITTAAVILTADIPISLLVIFTDKLHISIASLPGQIETVVLERPIPLILLVMTIFYLWVYVQRAAYNGE